MHHIKNDKRSQQSAEAIYRSIRHLCLKKPLNEITITDINEESGISRSTFYRNFDTIRDPLEWKLDFFFQEYLANRTGDPIEYFFKYWDRHSDMIYLLSTQVEDVLKTIMKKHVVTSDNVFEEYLSNLKISIMTSLLCKWVERNKKESVEQMVEITRQLFDLEYTNLLTNFQ